MTDDATFTLLNTRPVHQARALNEAVQSQGGGVLSCPTIEIQWLDQDASDLNIPAELSLIDKIIFTSVNAVQGFINSTLGQSYLCCLSHSDPSTAWFAIGKATQSSGLEAGLPLERLSQSRFDSESLLAHPVMQSVQNETVLIVKGVGGRSLLKETLQARGAHVDFFNVYERVPAPLCVENWLAFTQSVNPILLLTSVDSFEYLLTMLSTFDQRYADLMNPVWSFLDETVVFSERIKGHLQDRGWQADILVVASQSNEGILQTITECLATKALPQKRE